MLYIGDRYPKIQLPVVKYTFNVDMIRRNQWVQYHFGLPGMYLDFPSQKNINQWFVFRKLLAGLFFSSGPYIIYIHRVIYWKVSMVLFYTKTGGKIH